MAAEDWITDDMLCDWAGGELYDEDTIGARKGRMKEKSPKATMEDVRRNKFYVGSNGVFARNWGHADEAKAVQHARELLDQQPETPFVAIVKIVKIVKRAPRPAVVVNVK